MYGVENRIWVLIGLRYENKRELLGKLIDNMIQFSKIQSANAEQLESLHDTVYESIMAHFNAQIRFKHNPSLWMSIRKR